MYILNQRALFPYFIHLDPEFATNVSVCTVVSIEFQTLLVGFIPG